MLIFPILWSWKRKDKNLKYFCCLILSTIILKKFNFVNNAPYGFLQKGKFRGIFVNIL